MDVKNNHQRRRVQTLPVSLAVTAIRVVIIVTNGLDHARICEIRRYAGRIGGGEPA